MSLESQYQPQIERYRCLRTAAKRLISKMYEVARGPRFDIIKAAKKLTIPVRGRTVIFDGDTDTNALADFYFHEMRFGGKRIVDVLADSGADLTPDERDLLVAHRQARCSLFAVTGLDPAAHQINLRDLLVRDAPEVAFTDMHLSHCDAITPGCLLFTRLVHCDGLHMGAGLFFGFLAVHRIPLLNAYEARMATVDEKGRSQRTFVFFYQKNREFGMPQGYRDVT